MRGELKREEFRKRNRALDVLDVRGVGIVVVTVNYVRVASVEAIENPLVSWKSLRTGIPDGSGKTLAVIVRALGIPSLIAGLGCSL
ncbi:MAG: hypothetical protein JWR53_436 [Glaciihabitans sp.]|nr:hypothetical protein [Glaciihabitans sp.]